MNKMVKTKKEEEKLEGVKTPVKKTNVYIFSCI